MNLFGRRVKPTKARPKGRLVKITGMKRVKGVYIAKAKRGLKITGFQVSGHRVKNAGSGSVRKSKKAIKKKYGEHAFVRYPLDLLRGSVLRKKDKKKTRKAKSR